MATVQVGSMSPWKQNTGGDMYQVYKPRASPKPRPVASSPRYVRTWSQEEEAYLLEARRARVPYKDIAARLNKTDLACRLHYHQMVVARKNSTQEDNGTPVPEQHTPPVHFQSRSESLPPISTSIAQQSMILPAPIISTPSRCGSGILSPPHRRSMSQPQTPRRLAQSPPIGGIQKRSPTGLNKNGLCVDLGRIQELYRNHAPYFWSNIAAAYSGDRSLSPAEIENAFWAGQGMTRSEPMSPVSDSRSTSPSASWPSAVSTTSTMTSQASNDEPLYSAISPRSAGTSKTRCSVNALLNN